MRVKTLFVLAVAILVTVLVMQNGQEAKFNILFFYGVYVSKLSILLVVALASFAAGVAIAQPRKYKIDTTSIHDDEEGEYLNKKTNTLSDEDRDYIN